MKIKKGLQRKLRTPAVNDRIMMLFGQIACAAQCPLLGKSGQAVLHCICPLMTKSGHRSAVQASRLSRSSGYCGLRFSEFDPLLPAEPGWHPSVLPA